MQTQEVFGVLILNNQNQVLGVYNHTIGTQVSTQIDVTLIAAMIAKLAPKAAIIFHNHPSGNLIPSDADLVMTRQLKEALKILACQLLDSLIITDLGYYSLADEGKL
jgi:DNA repair protein RadC